MKAAINEIVGMFRDTTGKLSLRRFFALALLMGIIRLVEHSLQTDCKIDNAALTTLCGTMLLLLAVITWQNVQELKPGLNGTH